jgi:hypothetical protein
MKKLVLALVMIFAVMAGRAQSFEGVIHWNMKMEITDPKVKAQMEEAKKKANDPANQAKMKEFEAKMNDPQFKAMMEKNPQMKAQMEAMMKVMQGGDMNAMMPTGIAVKMKGANTLTSIQGGIMDKNDILHLSDKDVTYNINHASKTYMTMKHNANTEQKTTPKITKTSETQKILGYTCTKYIVEQTQPDGKTMTTNYWATTEIKDVDLKALAKQQTNQNQSFIFTEIEGVPLKIEVMMPQGNMTMECNEFKKETVPASTFALPSGYSETKI